jgi:hypothetical protein
MAAASPFGPEPTTQAFALALIKYSGVIAHS